MLVAADKPHRQCFTVEQNKRYIQRESGLNVRYSDWEQIVNEAVDDLLDYDELILHRFDSDVSLNEVRFDEVWIRPHTGNEKVIGVSFFAPINDLFHLAHIRVSEKTGSTRCFLYERWNLPDGLELDLDEPLYFRPYTDHHPYYPSSFRSLSNAKSKLASHGLHFSLYPATKMKFEEFKQKVASFHCTAPCLSQQFFRDLLSSQTSKRERDEEGNEDEPDSIVFDTAVNRTSFPFDPRMRFVCESLSQYSNKAPYMNDRLLSYLLFHHIGAMDLPFTYLSADSTFSRLVYRAMSCFVPPNVVTADSLCSEITDLLESYIPPRLHAPSEELSSESSAHDAQVRDARQGNPSLHAQEMIEQLRSFNLTQARTSKDQETQVSQ
jgi:hypothetical protein